MHGFSRLFWTATYGIGLLLLIVLSAGSDIAIPYLADSDLLSHFLAYSGATMLAGLAFSAPRHRLLAAIATFSFGVMLESVQALLPNRTPDMLDIVANGAGVLLGFFLSQLIQRAANSLNMRTSRVLPRMPFDRSKFRSDPGK